MLKQLVSWPVFFGFLLSLILVPSSVLLPTQGFAASQVNIITTIAGNGIRSYSGDGGLATQASLSKPAGIAFDSVGNMYIADMMNHRIRKVDTNGIITTIAGNGIRSYSGDGGLATQASMNQPIDVRVDSNGNIYFADYRNHRIRKVDTNGIITTVAGNGNAGYSGDGGDAILASLNFPHGIVISSNGNIYIADVNNHRIRKVDTNGIITTVAGNGNAGFSGDGGDATLASLGTPRVVGLDSDGNVYADTGHRIRKVDTNGIITTVAGNGKDGFSGDGGDATLSSFNVPNGVVVDSIGNIYITDANNHRIRKVDINGIITTIAGNGILGYSGDGGDATLATLNVPGRIILGFDGNIYFADYDNHRIRKIEIGETPITGGTVPTLSEWGMMFLAALLIVGFWRKTQIVII